MSIANIYEIANLFNMSLRDLNDLLSEAKKGPNALCKYFVKRFGLFTTDKEELLENMKAFGGITDGSVWSELDAPVLFKRISLIVNDAIDFRKQAEEDLEYCAELEKKRANTVC